MKARTPAAVPVRIWIEWFETIFFIRSVDHVGNEPFEAVFFNPLGGVFWKQVLSVPVILNNIMINWYKLYMLTHS